MLSSLNVDDALAFLDDESSEGNAYVRCRDVDSPSYESQPCCLSSATSKRSISRVLIFHNDRIASFSDSSCSSNNSAADFFDTPAFWSGSITWW
jgi:hypothetical protein